MTDDNTHNEQENNKLNMKRIEYMLCPLLGNVLVLIMVAWFPHIITEGRPICYVFGLVYFYMTLGVHYALKHTGRRAPGLFDEMEVKAQHQANWFSSPELPKEVPLCHDGFLYAIPKGERYDRPYKVYYAEIKIGEYAVKERPYDLSRFKYDTLRAFEVSVGQVTAIQDKYGVYLWYRAETNQRSKIDKLWYKSKLIILRTIFFISAIMPLIVMYIRYRQENLID